MQSSRTCACSFQLALAIGFASLFVSLFWGCDRNPPTASNVPAQTSSSPATPDASSAAASSASNAEPAKPASPSLTEAEKIERLLLVLEQSQATFIRSGSAYDGKRAAEHLRTKLKSAGSLSLTALEFIEHVASKSSLSGRDYQVRDSGATSTSRAWFTQRLAELEAGAK